MVSTRTYMGVWVASMNHRQVQKTRFARNTMRKLNRLGRWKKTLNRKRSMMRMWKHFLILQLSLCSFPLMKSGLADFVTDLSFKEDHKLCEQQQNLLFFHRERTIWMVCYLQGWILLWDFGEPVSSKSDVFLKCFFHIADFFHHLSNLCKKIRPKNEQQQFLNRKLHPQPTHPPKNCKNLQYNFFIEHDTPHWETFQKKSDLIWTCPP